MDHNKAVGRAVAALRKEARITQAQLEKKLAFNSGLVAKLEAGHRLTHARTAALAGALGVTWAALIARAESMLA